MATCQGRERLSNHPEDRAVGYGFLWQFRLPEMALASYAIGAILLGPPPAVDPG